MITPRCAYSFGCTAWVSNGQDQRTADAGFRVVSSMSYVTGSHNFKVGFSDSFGPVHVFTDRQADLVQTYNNGRPHVGDGLHDPVQSLQLRQLRPGDLRAGLVDDQAADAEPRRAPRQLRLEDRGDVDAGRPVRRRALFPGARARAAVAVGRLAAGQHGLRPVRRRPHGAEGELQPLSRSAHGRLRRSVLAGRGERDPQLVRLHDQRGGQRVRHRRVRCRPTTTTSRRRTKSGRAARRSASAKIAISIPTFSASGTRRSRSACSISCSRACRSSRSTIAARSRTWRCSTASSSPRPTTRHSRRRSRPTSPAILRSRRLSARADLVTIYNLRPAKLPVYTSQQRDKTNPGLDRRPTTGSISR